MGPTGSGARIPLLIKNKRPVKEMESPPTCGDPGRTMYGIALLGYNSICLNSAFSSKLNAHSTKIVQHNSSTLHLTCFGDL